MHQISQDHSPYDLVAWHGNVIPYKVCFFLHFLFPSVLTPKERAPLTLPPLSPFPLSIPPN